MARRADGRFVDLPGVPAEAVELPEHRWKHGVCFDLGGGQKSYIITRPIHREVGGIWQEIDNRWLPGVLPWDFQMTGADYAAYALSRFDAGRIVRLEKNGHYVTLQPMTLAWTNDLEQIQQIAIPARASATAVSYPAEIAQGGTLTYPGAFGQGMDFTYTPLPERFKKELSVDALTRIGSPSQVIQNGGNPAFSLSFIFTSDLPAYIDGVAWDRKTRRDTANRIEFRDGETVVSSFLPPIAFDSAGNVCQGSLRVHRAGNSYYVSVLIPWAWIASAVFPVLIDPTTDYSTVDVDGYINGDSATYTTAHSTSSGFNQSAAYGYVGQKKQGSTYTCYRYYTRFDTSGITDSDTVTQANLYASIHATGIGGGNFIAKVMECSITTPVTDNRETDFDAIHDGTNAGTWVDTASQSATDTMYASANLGVAHVNKTGYSDYGLMSDRDISETAPSGAEWLQVHTEEETTYYAYLRVVTSSGNTYNDTLQVLAPAEVAVPSSQVMVAVPTVQAVAEVFTLTSQSMVEAPTVLAPAEVGLTDSQDMAETMLAEGIGDVSLVSGMTYPPETLTAEAPAEVSVTSSQGMTETPTVLAPAEVSAPNSQIMTETLQILAPAEVSVTLAQVMQELLTIEGIAEVTVVEFITAPGNTYNDTLTVEGIGEVSLVQSQGMAEGLLVLAIAEVAAGNTQTMNEVLAVLAPAEVSVTSSQDMADTLTSLALGEVSLVTGGILSNTLSVEAPADVGVTDSQVMNETLLVEGVGWVSVITDSLVEVLTVEAPAEVSLVESLIPEVYDASLAERTALVMGSTPRIQVDFTLVTGERITPDSVSLAFYTPAGRLLEEIASESIVGTASRYVADWMVPVTSDRWIVSEWTGMFGSVPVKIRTAHPVVWAG